LQNRQIVTPISRNRQNRCRLRIIGNYTIVARHIDTLLGLCVLDKREQWDAKRKTEQGYPCQQTIMEGYFKI